MSSEKWSGDNEATKSESPAVAEKNGKKKNRKLSWQTIYDCTKVHPKEEVIKLECTLENAQAKDPFMRACISDGEMMEEGNRKRQQKGRRTKKGSSKSASFQSSHRRVKSLIPFELNDYSLREIRQIHEEIESRPMKPFAAKVAFLKGFTRQQRLVLACLCLVEFTSFCSSSIMAPFFPKEAGEKGMSETTAGLVFSFYAFVVFVSSPLFGKILPHVGGKFLFLSGVFVTSVCNLLFGVLHYIRDDRVFCVFCFLVQGMKALGCSAYWTAAYVFVCEVFPSNIGAVLGMMETFIGLGMSIGPAVGGFFYHIGGFGLPFYILGSVLVLTCPVAFYVLPITRGKSVRKKSGSFVSIITEPCVIIISLVVVVASSVWGFLDPTLEPHLRQFNLTPEKIGLIFLLFSAMYGLSSPLWGWLSDKSNNHWLMMTSGLAVSTVALLLLGPAPFIPFLKTDLRLDLAALAVLGTAVSLSMLPTFQGLLTAVAVATGQPETDISTYSSVAGIWSSLYALGEVIGPLVGGILTENYDFHIGCTVVAGATFTLSIGSFIYFSVRDCLAERGKNYRYKFEDSDGYDSDCSDNSEDLNRPLLQPAYQNRLYTEENSL